MTWTKGWNFLWKNTAGLVSYHNSKFALHFGCSREHWIWGYQVEEYDKCMDYYGLGPLVLLVVPNW